MARTPSSKTKLGQRLIQIRGEERRVDYCARLGLSASTYGNYEKGDRLPDTDILAIIAEANDINLNWLILGEGPMRLVKPDVVSFGASGMDKEFFARVLEVVGRTYKEVGARITERDLARLSMEKYEEYIELAEDPADNEERQALMGLLHKRLKKQLTATPADQDETKRQA
ncbi:helix-turn-helix domain-containing protein [Pseudovibrio ascidiaceicola]|uniref:helix-turn-helix domain-containing protein n=1 Tax=Pseudovibrio ascidiaceicola TaxID=285279 RepID=UPI003D36A870